MSSGTVHYSIANTGQPYCMQLRILVTRLFLGDEVKQMVLKLVMVRTSSKSASAGSVGCAVAGRRT